MLEASRLPVERALRRSYLACPFGRRVPEEHDRTEQLIDKLLGKATEELELLPVVGRLNPLAFRPRHSIPLPLMPEGHATVLSREVQICVRHHVARGDGDACALSTANGICDGSAQSTRITLRCGESASQKRYLSCGQVHWAYGRLEVGVLDGVDFPPHAVNAHRISRATSTRAIRLSRF
jgi:hypothetical protein